MSVVSLTDVQCETVQRSLDSQFEGGNSVLDPMPALEAIIAQQKAMGLSQEVFDGKDGKVKTVKVTYDQRALESDASDTSGERSCTSTNRTYNNFTTYDIDPTAHVTYGETFKVSELAKVCQPFEEFLAKKLNKIIDVIERKVATKTAQALVALYGNWGGSLTTGTAIGEVNTSSELILGTFISAAAKTIDYTAMTTLDNALMVTGFSGTPIIIGGSTMWAYGRHVEAGCCSTTGVNVMELAAQHGKAIMFDKRVATALGSKDKAIAFQPGSLALLTYNEYDETGTIRNANYIKMKVFAPRTGLPIDVVIKDDCGSISINAYAVTELVGLPADMFAVGDEFRGVKFVNKIKVVNPA